VIGTAQAARVLGVDESTVIRWAQAGKIIPAAKLPGANGAYLFTLTSIEHLASQRKEGR